MLERYDRTGTRQLGAEQVSELVQDMVDKEVGRRNYRRLAVVLFAFAVLMLVATFGLTWAVVSSLKDTKVNAVENDE